MTGLAWLRGHLGIVAAVGLALVLLHDVQGCRQQRDLAGQLARAREAQTLAERGQEVVREATRREMQGQVDELRRRVPELEAALEAARRAGAGSAVAAISASTGDVAAHGAARPCPAGPPAENGSPPVPVLPGAACLLAEGDQGRIDVAEVVLRAEHGTHVLVGAAQAWRTSPAPATKLFGGPFSAPLTSAIEVPPPPEVQRARWAFHGGPVWERWQLSPTGGELGGEVRVLGPAWLTAGLRIAEQSSAQVHLRWEW